MANTDWKTWRSKKIKQFEHELGKTHITAKLFSSMDNYISYIYIGNFFISTNRLTRETTIFNTKTKKTATAKCSMSDSFTIADGVAIAWARYTNSPIPTREETIFREALKNGDIFYRPTLDTYETFTFIGWVPNTSMGTMGKWAVVLEKGTKVIKLQIPEVVNKV